MKKQPYKAWYKCINNCTETHSLTEIIYRCPQCGDILEVQHDLERLKSKSPQEWKNIFTKRFQNSMRPFASGVWSKKEWVCPDIEDTLIISIGEGRTPLFPAKKLAKHSGIENLCVKLCGNSHTGSFKDLGMTVLVSMVNKMLRHGQNIKAIACASTGDTSAALAAYCAAAGIPSMVLLPKNKISTAQLIQPIANSTLTLSLDTDFDGCMQIVQKLTDSKEIYLANSMNSLRIEGQKTVSFELLEQLNWQVPDWVIVPGGNLGNVSAIGKGFLEMQAVGLIDRLPRLVCAQAKRANPLFESYKNGYKDLQPLKAGETLASAIQIGNPVSYKKAVGVLKITDGLVEQAGEEELANASALADRDGLFTCPQTGVALAAFLRLVERKEIKPRDSVVVISTAHGLKFVDFKINYHEQRLSNLRSKHANLPMELPADVGVIHEQISKFIKAKS